MRESHDMLTMSAVDLLSTSPQSSCVRMLVLNVTLLEVGLPGW